MSSLLFRDSSSPSSLDAAATNDDASTFVLNFGAFPRQSLRVSLHSDVDASTIPDDDDDDDDDGRFGALDAGRGTVVSVGHLVAAASSALLRAKVRPSIATTRLAKETILCVGGSTHAGSSVRDYALRRPDDDNDDAPSTRTVLLLGWNCAEDEFARYRKRVVGDAAATPLSWLSRPRTDAETGAIAKAFKITADELAASTLELAVIHRVCTKFHA